ncbi:MAG: hemolysin family protein [Deltaproteobacteria bacterium]|nr:hemolysin family protein [Deltaproteobacteria bacterium]
MMTLGVVASLFFLFLLLEGFFSGSELALVSCDKTRLRHAAMLGSKRAQLAQRFITHPELLFSTTILGSNMFVVTNTVIVTLFIHGTLGEQYAFLTLFLSPLILIFGELVPKSLFRKKADTLVLNVGLPLTIFSYLFYPVVIFFSKLTRLLLGKVAEERQAEGEALSRDELKELLNIGEAKTLLWERGLLFRLFHFSELPVDQVMTPIAQVFAMKGETTLADAMNDLAEEAYSRVPVYDKKIYNIVGVLEVVDLLFQENKNLPVRQCMKSPYYVPTSMSAGDLLQVFQREGKNMAIVVDEFGSTIGVITSEDLVEEIVGEIEDEYDEPIPLIKKIGPKQYLLSAQVRLKDLEEELHLGLPAGLYQTLNGFLIAAFHRIPEKGETFRHGELTFMVKQSTPRAIQEVLLELGP